MTTPTWICIIWAVLFVVWAIGIYRNYRAVQKIKQEIKERQQRINEIEQNIAALKTKLENERKEIKERIVGNGKLIKEHMQ